MSGPLVTVVVPSFDRARVLKRCVESILIQTWRELELIVVDDGSTDGTVAELDGLRDQRLRLVRQDHAGVCVARNNGAARALGDILVFVDSDDEARPDWLAQIVKRFADARVGIACCGATLIHGGRQPREETMLPRNLGPVFENRVALFLPGCFAIRRPIFEGSGGFTPSLRFGELTDLALRLLKLCVEQQLRIETVAEPLVIIRREAPSRRLSPERLQAQVDGIEHLLARHAPAFRKSRGTRANYWAVAGVSSVRLGNAANARRYFQLAFCAQPYHPKHLARLVLGILPSVSRRIWGNLGSPETETVVT